MSILHTHRDAIVVLDRVRLFVSKERVVYEQGGRLMANRLDLGKSYVDTEKFFARVTGGGAYGPAELAIFDGMKWRDLEICEDMRSGTERSRYVTYDTSRHGLYKFVRAAVSAGRVENGYFEHTEDHQIVRLSDAAVQRRQIELFPEYETILQVAREKELRQAEDWLQQGVRYQQKITERKAMAETARATLKSQGIVLPKLVGKSAKQIKFANDVRATIALSNPSLPELQTQTSAEWWIKHREGFTARGIFASRGFSLETIQTSIFEK